jgi:hypothetical protein
MTNFWILLLALECLAMVVWGLAKHGRIYQYPFLAGVTWGGFVLPQLLGLRHDPTLPAGALGQTTFMVALCAGMGWLGYALSSRGWKSPDWGFRPSSLLKLALCLSLSGSYFFLLLNRLPDDMTSATQWSGLPVAYLFLAHILTYGLALALFVWASTRSLAALSLCLFGSAFYVDRIVFSGRRGDTLEFSFLVLLAFWFTRRQALARPLMLGLVLMGTLLLHSTGEYRSRVAAEKRLDLRDVASIPFVGNLRQVLTEGGQELRAAVFEIHSASYHGAYDWGAFHWNALVFNFVPQQLVGQKMKAALMLKTPELAPEEFGFQEIPGATLTGATDSFLSFWYFGCLKFFFIGWVVKKVWLAAQAGLFFHQLCYALILAPVLHTITHHTQWFVTPWVQILVFLVPGLKLIRMRPLPQAGFEPAGAAA